MARLPTYEDLGERPIARPARGAVGYQSGIVSRTLTGAAAQLSDVAAQIKANEDTLERERAALAEAKYRNAIEEGYLTLEQRVASGEILAQKPLDEEFAKLSEMARKQHFEGIRPDFLPTLNVAADGIDIRNRGGLRKDLFKAQQVQQKSMLSALVDERLKSGSFPSADVDELDREIEYAIRSIGPQAGLDAGQIQQGVEQARQELFSNDLKRRFQETQEDLGGLERLQHHVQSEDGYYNKLNPVSRLAFSADIASQQQQLLAKKAQQARSLLSGAQLAALSGLPTPPEDVETAIKDLPPVEQDIAREKYKQTQITATAFAATKGSSIPEDTERLRALKPTQGAPEDVLRDQFDIYNSFVKAVEQKHQALKTDPAAYVASPGVSTPVAAALAATKGQTTIEGAVAANTRYANESLAAQKRLGAANPRILTDAQIAEINSQFYDKATGGLKGANAIYEEQAKWGIHWPQVQTELLRDAELPNAVRVIASGVPPQSAEILARLSTEDLKAMKKGVLDGVKFVEGDVSREINEKFADFLQATANQPDGYKQYEAFYDQAERIVYDGVRKGKSVGDAVDSAYQILFQDITKKDRYGFGETFIAPASAGPVDRIESGAEKVLDSISLADIDTIRSTQIPQELTPAQALQYVKRDGYWVTDKGNRGLMLYVNNRSVVDRDGNIVFRTWDELNGTAPKTTTDIGVSFGPFEREVFAEPLAPPLTGKPLPGSKGSTRKLEAQIPTKEELGSQGLINPKNVLPIRNSKPVVPYGQEAALAELPVAERKRIKDFDDPLFDEYAVIAARAAGLPDENLALAIKNYGEKSNSDAVNKKTKAAGLMQFIPSSQKLFGLDDPFDPLASIDAGIDHLRDVLNRTKGNIDAAIVGYNASPKVMKDFLAGKPIPKETRDYLKRVKEGLAELAQRRTSVAEDEE